MSKSSQAEEYGNETRKSCRVGSDLRSSLGVGGAVLVQQFGLLPPQPYLLYGVPAFAAVLSVVWSRHGVAALIVLIPSLVLAQANTCNLIVIVPGVGDHTLQDSTVADPVIIPADVDQVEVVLQAHEPGMGEVWVEIGGFRVEVDSEPVGAGGIGTIVRRDAVEAFGGVGLYHIGGSVEECVLAVDTYV